MIKPGLKILSKFPMSPNLSIVGPGCEGSPGSLTAEPGFLLSLLFQLRTSRGLLPGLGFLMSTPTGSSSALTWLTFYSLISIMWLKSNLWISADLLEFRKSKFENFQKTMSMKEFCSFSIIYLMWLWPVCQELRKAKTLLGQNISLQIQKELVIETKLKYLPPFKKLRKIP